MTLTDHPGKGDSVRYETYVPGETPCISAYASTLPPRPTETPDATPYSVQASGLRGSVVLGARLVLRRAGVIIADASSPSTNDNISADLASPPIPGDVIELYRPQTATTPVATYVLPSVKATYDPSNSLFALDAPAASYIGAYTRQLDFNSSASRGAIDTAAGRTLLNFAAADGDESPSNLALADAVYADWFSADNVHRFEVAAVRGDLAPPVLSVKLGSKFKLAKIGSSIPATVSSNEVASAKLTLTLPAKLKTSSAKKKPKGPTTIASASGSLIAGSAKFKLKLTKSGKKLIKKLRAAHGPTQKATLTVTAVDSSGNASTKVKTTKLVAK
jgi:hypothetical protein